MQSLKKLFRLSLRSNAGLSECAEHIDQSPDIDLPFLMTDVRTVYERFKVLTQVIKPVRSSLLVDFLAETPGDPVLFTDASLSGSDALFVGWLAYDLDRLVEQLMKKMTVPSIFVGTGHGDVVVLVPMSAYRIV